MPVQPADQPNSSAPGDWGIIRVAGSDRRQFLQGQLTQDVNRLEPGLPLLTGWTNPKGRLLCTAWLFEWRDADWLVLPGELVDRIAKRLQMYILRADVTVTPNAAIVRAVPAESLADFFEVSSKDKLLSCCLLSDSQAALRLQHLDRLALLITSDGKAETPSPSLNDAWRLGLIDAGLPVVWQSTAEEFVPQMVNLELLDGVSFKKGCYVGQEIVARTQNLGRIKRRMFALAAPAETEVMPGSGVFSGSETVGQVVDAIAARDEVRLLAVIRIDKVNSELWLDPNGQIRLSRRSLPYSLPESSEV